MMMKKQGCAKFLIEFVSVFVAVVFAFTLNKWNENRKDSIAEEKILYEISNGLKKDLDDIASNMDGHRRGIAACKYWRKVVRNEAFSQDSVWINYILVTRDFISIQNRAGYETLKSKGLELITNDSLRLEIISLYEYDFNNLQKLEERYDEMQFYQNYYQEFSRIVSPFLVFDERGVISSIKTPLELNRADKNLLLSYLWKIEVDRNFILYYYSQMQDKTKKLIADIEKELK